MHLVGPYLTTTGKSKKKKFRSSADAARAREIEKEWQELEKRWGITDKIKKEKPVMVELPTQNKQLDRATLKISSLNNGVDRTPAIKANIKTYTGNDVLGITVLHKSCLQPVFNKQEAIDAAAMRRG